MHRTLSRWVAGALLALTGHVSAQVVEVPPLNGGPPSTQLPAGVPAATLSGAPAVGLSGGPGSVALSGGPGSVALSGGNGLMSSAILPGPMLPFSARPSVLPGGVPAPGIGLTPLPGSTPGLRPSRPGLSPLTPTPLPVTPTP